MALDRLINSFPNCGPACDCQKTFTVGDVSRFMPAYLPFPSMGVTVATLDIGGNLTIKVDQPSEPPVREELDRLERALNEAAVDRRSKLAIENQHVPDWQRGRWEAIEEIRAAIAMPVRPIREAPETIALAVVLGFGSDWWFQTNDLTRHEVREAIAAAIRAERG